MDFRTADLVDEHGEALQSCDLQLRQLGGRRRFHGPIRTVACFQDNALVKQVLSEPGDGAVLVVRAGRTPHAAVEKAVEAIGRDRILGVVLNGVEEDGASPYGHYYGGEPNSGAAVPRLRE